MSKVIKEFHVGKYSVLILDHLPDKTYRNFLIKGKNFIPVPVYDGKNCVAVESKESFIGETIEFIS